MLTYTFVFMVGGRDNARRVVQVEADERWTVLVDRCAEANQWINAKPDRQVKVLGPGLATTFICQAVIDSIAHRFEPKVMAAAQKDEWWTDPWANL